MKKAAYILLAIIVLAVFAASFYIYPQLPARVPIHWGASGEADGWGGAWGAAFGMPIGILVGAPLMIFLPRIDPRWKNIQKSEGAYLWFLVGFAAFMAALHVFTLFWGLGYTPSMNRFMGIAMGLLFVLLGWLMTQFKQNYTIGFRTSWALADPVVWDKTQRFGAWGFGASGVLALLAGIFFEEYVIWFILVPVLAIALSGMVYSYLIYHARHPQGE